MPTEVQKQGRAALNLTKFFAELRRRNVLGRLLQPPEGNDRPAAEEINPVTTAVHKMATKAECTTLSLIRGRFAEREFLYMAG